MAEEKKRVEKLTWEGFGNLCNDLLKSIKLSEHDKPIVVVAKHRGGLPLGTYLSHHLGARLIVYRQGLEWDGSVIYLLVDDLVDSGATMMKMIHEVGFENTWVAVLDYKLCSRVKPDFYVRKWGADVWLQYPWETDESSKRDENEV